MYFNKHLIVKLAICVIVCCYANASPFSEKRINANPEVLSSLTKAGLTCMKEIEVDQQIFIQIHHGNIPETDEVKDFFYCAFTKHGASSEDGVINPQKLLQIYPEDFDKTEVTQVLDKCIQDSEQFTVPKEKIFNVFKCFQQNTPAHVL